MTMKYVELLQRLHYRGLLLLALMLGPAFAVATPTQATVAGQLTTGSASDTAIDACVIATPSLSLSPSSPNAMAGTGLEYTISLTNNDDKACGASNFDLTVTYLPSGWTADLSNNALNLTPAATATATLWVTPAGDAATDSYKLQVAVSDAQEPTHARAAMANSAFNGPATNVANVMASTLQIQPVSGESSAPVNLSPDPATDSVGVAGGRLVRDGSTISTSNSGRVDRESRAEIAGRLTLRLNGLLSAYNRASENAKVNALNELVAAAEERHALLAGLIADDPGAVLRVAVPARVREDMPAEARAFIEQRLGMQGELEVKYEDYTDGSHRLHHSLEDNGRRITMHFMTNPPSLLSGEHVVAHGVYVPLDDQSEASGAMALQSGEQILTLAVDGGSGGGSNGGTPGPVPNTLGEQRTLVILVNFQDHPVEPFTIDEARSFVFGPASDFLRENSYGQTWLAGEVYGWYTLPTTSTCSDTVISEKADAIAATSGVNLSDFSRIVYVYPSDSCGLGGQSTVGGNPSRAYIYVFPDLRVFDHELGHNLGLFHSHGMNCVGAVVGSDCETLEYGDRLDIMGGRPLHFNAFQKERLGWLNYGASPPVTTIQADGSFQLKPYEQASPDPHALKIFRDLDPVSGQPRNYYLEYRQLLGFDAVLRQDPYANPDNIVNGVVFHLGTAGEDLQAENSSFLLDMTPDTSTSSALDLDDAALIAGRSYTDSTAGVTISTDWADETGATVSVSYGQAACAHSNPLVVISPSQGPWVAPATAVSYIATVTNADNGGCPSSTFDLSAVVSTGWTSNFVNPTLTLAPGTSGSVNLTVTSPATAADGFYDILVTAMNSAEPPYAGSAAATYVVSAPAVDNPPVAIDDSATLDQVQPIVIDVLANDWDPDRDRIWVQAMSQGTKGTVKLNDDGTLTYTPVGRFKNSDRFTYDITDGLATASASVTISLQKSPGGSGNGKGGGK